MHSMIPYSGFFPSVLKFVLFVLLLLRMNIFSARPAHVRRGVVHVRTQETKIKLTKIHIFLRRTKNEKTPLYGIHKVLKV